MFKLRFSSQKITDEDCIYIKRASNFAIEQLDLKQLMKENSIVCDITDDIEENSLGLCVDNGFSRGRRKIEIQISSKTIKNYKSTKSRLKQTVKTIFHELAHTRQYLRGDLVHHDDGSYSYKERHYSVDLKDDVSSFTSYYTNPAEIEAYGVETCLYDLFEFVLKKENQLQNGKEKAL